MSLTITTTDQPATGMAQPSSLKDAVADHGFAIVENVAGDSVEMLVNALANELSSDRPGTRQLHQRVPLALEFLRNEPMTEIIAELIPGAFPVRSIFFDKSPERNWHVAWHQDLSICVQERHDMPGFSAWSVKDGVQHVLPPRAVLEQMLTIRLHLDDCGVDNGPLQVIPGLQVSPGSHRYGKRMAEDIALCKTKGPITTCVVPRGGAVIMKPLLLHSSRPATKPKNRRVLHIELASEPLPHPLEWIS
jgi:ectoine hydroxylase-related dioxygenase (phytanoyl-CoA dioxygenase family)